MEFRNKMHPVLETHFLSAYLMRNNNLNKSKILLNTGCFKKRKNVLKNPLHFLNHLLKNKIVNPLKSIL